MKYIIKQEEVVIPSGGKTSFFLPSLISHC